MFRLTREVRFAINATPDRQLAGPPTNSYGGYPSLTGLGYYFTLHTTLTGEVDPASRYLRNIKEIDAIARKVGIPVVEDAVRQNTFGGGGRVLQTLFDRLKDGWPPATLDCLSLAISPYQKWEIRRQEVPMVRLSQKFEFSASHRLHNPSLADDVNTQTYGKCNNPHGHGHNYELQVTVAGVPDSSGMIINVPDLERIVSDTVVRKFDHKNLNVELTEFKDVIPTVENIAMTIYRLLKPALGKTKLASVTVWETPKTWCEYSE
jgi:6-pyruvoyltetrahydropterin/6-carboxytetrahydropterin synthase